MGMDPEGIHQGPLYSHCLPPPSPFNSIQNLYKGIKWELNKVDGVLDVPIQELVMVPFNNRSQEELKKWAKEKRELVAALKGEHEDPRHFSGWGRQGRGRGRQSEECPSLGSNQCPIFINSGKGMSPE